METGQKFFRPKIKRGPKTSREKTKSLFEHLHDKISERRALDNDNSDLVSPRQQTKEPEESSPNIYQDFKDKQIVKIFQLLDHDGDGMISTDQVSFAKVN